MKKRFGLLIALLFFLIPTQSHSAPKCYVDRGKKVCFPLGEASFADAVVQFEVGNPAPRHDTQRIGAEVLGPPDSLGKNATDPQKKQNFLTMGCGGTVTVQFRDNALINVDGPDLYIFEVGKDVEPTYLAISADGKRWLDVGLVKGGLATVDISGVAEPAQEFRFVRLQDAKKGCKSRWPGSDIDAIGAIGSVAVQNGQLHVSAAPGLQLAPAAIGLIFDASNSMWTQLPGGRTRIEIAKQAIKSIVSKVPPGPTVGLRVYGHRLPKEPKESSCADTQLVIPFGPLDRNNIGRVIDALKPKGQTPIGRSIALMEVDLRDETGFKLIIVVSDGIESCSPEPTDANYPPQVVRSMQERGVKFRVNVVGFDIGQSETRQFLTEIAETSGGRYVGAGNARELESAIHSAIELAYVVLDASGSTVFEGTVGANPIDLPAGKYSIVVQSKPEFTISNVEVSASKETRLTVHAIGAVPKVETQTFSIRK